MKKKEKIIEEAWMNNGMAMPSAQLEVLIDIRDALVKSNEEMFKLAVAPSTEKPLDGLTIDQLKGLTYWISRVYFDYADSLEEGERPSAFALSQALQDELLKKQIELEK